MKRLLHIILLIAGIGSANTTNAQLADGSIAPDWTLTDINGTSHNLYNLLDSGYTVIIEMFATWCAPCWSHYQTGALQDVWANHGPAGHTGVSSITTDDVYVFMIESDSSTTAGDIAGTGNNTQGDWLTGTDFPIIDDAFLAGLYNLAFYPTVYSICRNRQLTLTGQQSATQYYNFVGTCTPLSGTNNGAIIGYTGETVSCSPTIDVTVNLQNMGSANLTSTTIEVMDGSTSVASLNWTGNLAAYNIEEVTLASIVPSGTQTYTIEITSTDDNAADNSISQTLSQSLTATGPFITVEIETNQYGSETTWELLDLAGAQVASGGPYNNLGSPGTTVQPAVDVALTNSSDCYEFIIYDSYGDGMAGYGAGNYTITDNSGTILVSGGDFTSEDVGKFKSYCWEYGPTIADVFCGSYTLNGQTYTSSGTYIQTLTNLDGCDSLITLNLGYNSSSSSISQTACGSYSLNGQTYTSNGTFTQILTNAAGCDSTITLDLTINNNQFPLAFQANPTAGTTPLNVIFDNQTPNLSNYNFTWSFGDGTVVQDNGSFVSHTYQSDGTWDVMLIAEDITTGCTDTLFNNGYIFSTGGTPCGHVAAITQSGPITACLSDSIFLSCNTDPNFTYQWQLNGFPISGATDQTYYPSQSGSYMVVITDNNCPVFSSTIQVTINTFTAPTISGAGSISSCSGGSMTLSVPDDYISYLWSSGGTDTSEVVTSSGDYTVTVTNVSGCQATSSVYSINASLIPTQEICIVTVDSASAHNLVVWEKPIVAGIDSFIVYREMGTNNYMPIGSVAYDSLSQFVDTANGINPNVTSYRYKVSILDTCGTESNLSYYHETMHLSTNQGIGGEVNLIWDEYEGFPIVYYYILRDSTANGNWEVLDSVSSNNFIYTDLNPPVSGVNYVIEVLPPNTCTSTKAQDHNTTRSNRASIVDGGGQGIFQHPTNNVNIYPNPTSDQITIDIKGYNGLVNVELYDLQGRLLETTTNTKVSLKKHAKGIYVLKVSYGDITEEVRVVRD